MGGDTDTNKSCASSTYPKYAAGPKGKLIVDIYRGRLRQLTDGGQYRAQGLMDKIVEAKASGDEHVKLFVWSPEGLSRPTFKEATGHEFKPTSVGQSFGPSWSTHWFKVQLTIPEQLLDKEHIEFQWDSNSEAMIWTEKGDVVHGLTGGGERTEWTLPSSYRDGKEHTFYVEMACNGMFGNPTGGDTIQPPDPNRYFQLSRADICAINLDARALYYDFWIIGDAAREFRIHSWECHEALQICNEIMDCFIAKDGSKEGIRECREIARRYIGNTDSADIYDGDKKAIVTGIGHCHIDTCWLWPWAETKRKVARSWSSQCELLDRYPEHRFCASQAQQYKWLKQYYPSTFDRVKVKVTEGTFQPIGGSWVEHDTNMPSGESLVRQFVYGQRFFESHFGQRCKTFWLPDTFGYSAQLPQLCRLAGMSRFFTQKLSWNNINNFPHTTFAWVALDGSQVICHMAPSDTYTSDAHFGDVSRSMTQHKSLDQDNTSLLVFGKGDGGGGPTFEHLEKLRRCRGLADKTGRLPRIQMGSSVEDFFDRLEKKAEAGTEYVTWYGELYFELHRGTYTTQANNKRNNREAEVMLHDVEFVATLASIKDVVVGSKKDGYKYPKKEIDEMWEDVLLCQFHDCLPGSSIEMCYDDSDELYKGVFEKGERVMVDALVVLGFHDLRKEFEDSQLCALNTLPWPRAEIVKLATNSGTHTYGLATGGIGLLNVQPLIIAANSAVACSIKELDVGVFQMSNSSLIVNISQGVITSIYDVTAQRELVPEGKSANQLVLFDDKPLYWQAWDVELFHLRSRKELQPHKSSIAENGPHCVSVVTETNVSEKSWVRSTISLSAAVGDKANMIVCEVEVEWRETMKFLKVEFPVDIVNPEASYETQFGIVKRPTHYNTSWDMAKFEVCCQKWADLSEAGYGVSVLNDSKYGFATAGNVMRLSLLRAPKAPDAHADMGRHKIRYAFLPHIGPLSSLTVRAARAFNSPIKLLPSDASASGLHPLESPIAGLMSAFRITGPGASSLVLDTIKRGEDDEDVSRGELPVRSGRCVVLRLYDAMGGKVRARIEWGKVPIARVWKCNLLEDDLERVQIEKGGADIVVKPFEVQTYRLELDD